MRFSICFFPLVGAVAGIFLILAGHLLALAGTGVLLRAAVLTVVPVAVTGAVHADGFLDTVDALASNKSAEDKLKILSDPHTGAFAVIAGTCYFLLMAGAFAETTQADLHLVAVGFVMSRALSGLSVVTFKKARSSGLLRTFSDNAGIRVVCAAMCVYILAAGLFLIICGRMKGGAMVLAALLVFAWYRHMSCRQFGGTTGDLAGFFLQVCELAMVLCAALVR